MMPVKALMIRPFDIGDCSPLIGTFQTTQRAAVLSVHWPKSAEAD
jgi:hypothetical protein